MQLLTANSLGVLVLLAEHPVVASPCRAEALPIFGLRGAVKTGRYESLLPTPRSNNQDLSAPATCRGGTDHTTSRPFYEDFREL